VIDLSRVQSERGLDEPAMGVCTWEVERPGLLPDERSSDNVSYMSMLYWQ
jgi:hypothetical protein